ncbi:bifunctional hydroxymethylpyrimidine kinase/phosphomethylpyrimidine kinase [Marinomonas sp. C2222]|uniref:hydroxymethylpyrimidine kinase n=1 Tax=Marinomonas sargassi TaxID=2984494 RepID=A0ABT2YRV0_9GAMM|nr:bifunctional hydroxymethylpyrimidine kinase/phosphomethylpyrimidine kinase [Marinomonas sargassi]MCV2402485.1 bifunctional hydroxymethylpyrimidine kinase/phosphomethylpyrimidine kinase [Marinomonas sargassi]
MSVLFEKTSSKATPIALTIAGSDSGGGAGIQADLKAFSANGVYGASVITAVTAQNTQAVTAVHAIPIDVVSAQISAVLSDLNVQAIKIGMLFSSELVEAVVQALKDFQGLVVLDPVMIAKSGDALLQEEAVNALKTKLIPHVDLLTPNYPEAQVLLGRSPNESFDEKQLATYATELLKLGSKQVLLKGGHGESETCTDVLVGHDEAPLVLQAQRINTKNTHGTGCTYSSSIAAWLAKGESMAKAVEESHRYLHRAIENSDQLDIGHGHGPVHHFHNLWAQK